MKQEIVKRIVADKLRIIPLATGAIIWLLMRIAGSAGLPLSVEEQNGISIFTAMALGWLLDGWALNVTSDGTKQNQEKLKEIKPWVEVDGVPGPQTQSAVAQVVEQSKP